MTDLIDRNAVKKEMFKADLIDRNAVKKEMFKRILLPTECEYDFGYNTAMSKLKEIVENAPAVNRWIPCSERLPEAGMPVLIYACKHRVTAYYDNCKNLFRLTENDNLYYIAEYVTHWMPLPEPPETDGGDKDE